MNTRIDADSFGAAIGLGIVAIVCLAIFAEALCESANRHLHRTARYYLRFFAWIRNFVTRLWRPVLFAGAYGLLVIWLPWWYIGNHGIILKHSPFWLILSNAAFFMPVLLLRYFPEPTEEDVIPERRNAIRDERAIALVAFATNVALAVAAIVTLGLDDESHGHAGLTKSMISVLGGGLAGNMLFRAAELLSQREKKRIA